MLFAQLRRWLVPLLAIGRWSNLPWVLLAPSYVVHTHACVGAAADLGSFLFSWRFRTGRGDHTVSDLEQAATRLFIL